MLISDGEARKLAGRINLDAAGLSALDGPEPFAGNDPRCQPGQAAWAAAERNLRVPEGVNCLHLVAAHEVRRSFPLDSVSVKGVYRPGLNEVVMPGVHSDVGGGHAPTEQGKGLAPDGQDMVSRSPLILMYREARLNGVPLKLVPGNPDSEDAMRAKLDDWVQRKNRARVVHIRSGGAPVNPDGLTPAQRAAAVACEQSGRKVIPRMPTEGREPFAGARAGYLRYRKVHAGANRMFISHQAVPGGQVAAQGSETAGVSG